jgi:hypothetical protein
MTAFRVGMKVCCVDDIVWSRIDGRTNIKSGLVEGEVYTIKAIRRVRSSNGYKGEIDCVVLDLHETAPAPEWMDSQGFNARRFRPIVSRPTSIAVFQAMLTGKKAEEPVNG